MAVTRYSIKVGDEVIDFEGPDDLTDRQIERLADRHLRTAKPGQRFSHSIYTGKGTYDSPDETSSVGAFMRGGLQGASSWTDELAAAGNAAIPGLAALDNLTGIGGEQQGPDGGSFDERYAKNMEEQRALRAADEEQHPTATSMGNLAGVASTILPAAKAFKALPVAAQAASEAHPFLTAIGLGGTMGAAQGSGASEGNRKQGAALGALGGAATAFGLTGAIKFAPTVARYAKMLFGKGVDENAVSQLQQALMRDGYDASTPEGAAALNQELARYGAKPVSLADVGQNTRTRAGVGMRSPSKAQQQSIDIVASRQAGQGQRLASDIRANVAPRTDVHALDEALVQQRAEQAGPLREKALFEDLPVEASPPPMKVIETPDGPNAGLLRTIGEEPPETFSRVPTAPEGEVPATQRTSRIVDDPELQQLARLPLAQRALTAALDQAGAERDLLATTGKPIDHLPDLTRGSQLDMRTMDYLKRYLDDEVTRLYKRGDTKTFSAQEANSVKSLRDAIRERLRTTNPAYGDYLDAYKGSSEMIDALDAGRNFDKLDPEQIATEQGGRSQAAQELYRVGTARNLLDKIRETKDGATAAKRILNSDESRAQLAATGVKSANLSDLNNAVGHERNLSLLTDELRGSQTDARRLAAEDAQSGSHVPLPFNPGSPFGWAGAAIRGVLNYGMPARNAAINEALLPRMLESNPEAVQQIINELEQHGSIAQARQLRALLKARQSSVGGGNLIGGMVALPNIGDDDSGS